MITHHDNKGFTLIELMIVVAIIGILAAIAIPNFMRFQAKSRQAEAKSNLGAIYTAIEAFRVEYGTYTTDLSVMGWLPSGSPRYNYGFQVDNFDPAGLLVPRGAGVSAGYNSTDLLPGAVLTYMTKYDGSQLQASDLPATAAVDVSNFTVGAVGNLDNDDTTDQWTLSLARQLTNVSGHNDVSE
jgi:type IV pilus assembly protein PilA